MRALKRLGDINGDGRINIYDVVLAVAAYGSKAGDENWNPDADVTLLYGVIEIYDIVTTAARYGSQKTKILSFKPKASFFRLFEA